MRSPRAIVALTAAVVLLALYGTVMRGPAVFAATSGVPTSVSRSGGTATAAFPTWNGSFSYGGTAYPFTMVGTDPSKGSATTTIPVALVPVRFVFSNGVAVDGSDEVQNVVASPIFQSAPFATGTTQYGDAIARGSFWSSVSNTSPGWHVLLAVPTVLPTETVTVPQNQGYEYTGARSGAPIGVVDKESWFDNQLANLVNALHIDPGTLAVFLTHNVGPISSPQNVCCVIGAHYVQTNSTSSGRTNTFIAAAYVDPGVFYPDMESFSPTDIRDVDIISHEVAEWLNDPFISNHVPYWAIPTGLASGYGCNNFLEVGDPLVGSSFTVTMPGGTAYQLQDEAFLSWFARTPVSNGFQQRYSYLGTFTSPSSPC